MGTAEAATLTFLDWEETGFAFNKFFVDPMALQAPPDDRPTPWRTRTAAMSGRIMATLFLFKSGIKKYLNSTRLYMFAGRPHCGILARNPISKVLSRCNQALSIKGDIP